MTDLRSVPAEFPAQMGFWSLVDRWNARRMQRPRRPLDVKAFIGFLFLAGYYWMAFRLQSSAMPAANVPLLRDMLLVLGPGVGLILGAVFRSDVADQQRTENTASAFRAVEAAAKAGTTTNGSGKEE